MAPGAETTVSSGRSEGPIWETGKVNFGIQARNTHWTSLRRGPCQEVAESDQNRSSDGREHVRGGRGRPGYLQEVSEIIT